MTVTMSKMTNETTKNANTSMKNTKTRKSRMTRKWSEVRAETPRTPEREQRVLEMRQAAETAYQLSKLREARGMTQVAMARQMHIGQPNVSKIERQDDLFVSTLRDYISAMGGRLELRAVFEDEVIQIMPGATV